MSSGHVDRTGLYIMVFLTLLSSCSAATDARRANEALKRISDAVQPAKAAGVAR